MSASFYSSRGVWPIVVVCVVLVHGCALRRPTLEKESVWVELERPRSEARAGLQPSWVVAVRDFRVGEPFDDRNFIFRKSEFEFEADFYREFVSPPAYLLAEQCRLWMSEAGVAKAVVAPGSRLRATHSLEVEVTELYWDIRDGARPRAVVGLQVSWIREAGDSPELIFRHRYRQEQPCDSAATSELLKGLRICLSRLFSGVETDLREGP